MEKTILVTGATDGIGEQTAFKLAEAGCEILLHGRTREKAERIAQNIIHETGNNKINIFIADLSSLAEVQKLAHSVSLSGKQLNVIINNAGVYQKKRILTTDGFETTFAVNYLAPFLLTNLLLPILKENAPSRIINVSSTTHLGARIEFENLQGEKHYDPYSAYAVSKLGNVLFTLELAEKLKDTGITVNALHPGVINTKLLRSGFGSMGRSPEAGAETLVYLALSTEVEGISGKYFQNKKEAPFNKLALDNDLRHRLWDISIKMTEKYL